MRITAISAGLGQPSSTRLLTDRLVGGLRAAGAHARIDVVELRDHAHDLINAELTGARTPALSTVLDQVEASDALVAVSPVFNAHPAALFQLFFEVLDDEALLGRPVLLGATGGTARHSLVLDHEVVPLFHYLHAVVSPISVFAATDDWGSSAGLDARIERAVTGFLPLLGVRPADRSHDAAASSDTENAEGSAGEGAADGDGTSGGGVPSRGPREHVRADSHDDLALDADFEQMMRALGH